MLFGLCDVPATFQSTMNDLFRPYLRKFVIIFVDDVLIYSNTMREHGQHLELVFKILTEAQFYLKRSKCLFGQSTIEYLGHIISERGVAPDQSKSRPCEIGSPHLWFESYMPFLGSLGSTENSLKAMQLLQAH